MPHCIAQIALAPLTDMNNNNNNNNKKKRRMHGTTYKNHNYICIYMQGNLTKVALTVTSSANMLSLQGMTACKLLGFESTKNLVYKLCKYTWCPPARSTFWQS